MKKSVEKMNSPPMTKEIAIKIAIEAMEIWKPILKSKVHDLENGTASIQKNAKRKMKEIDKAIEILNNLSIV